MKPTLIHIGVLLFDARVFADNTCKIGVGGVPLRTLPRTPQ